MVDGPTLETERLVLRRWRQSDLAPFAAMNADPAVMEYFPARLTRAESDTFAARIEAHFDRRGFGLWVVEIRETGTFAGFTGIAVPGFEAHFTPAVEVGWRLAYEHWGQGYAPEAAGASLDFAFGPLALGEVVAFTVPANHRSRRVMEKLGMHRAGADDFEHPALPRGHPLRPHVLYRIGGKEWVTACRDGSK